MHKRLALFALTVALALVAACINSNTSGPPAGADAGPPGGEDAALSSQDAAPSPVDTGADAPRPVEAGGDTSVEPPTDSGLDATVDAGEDAAAPICTTQPSLLALGADAGGTAVANDFTCPTGLDLDASTATLDFTGTGFARALQARQFENPGDGGEGDFASDAGSLADGGALTIAPGVHTFASFEYAGLDMYSGGDLTLEVAGPFTLDYGAKLEVQGNLTVVASGPMAFNGTLYVAGNLTIHQPSNAGIVIGVVTPSTVGSAALYAGYTDTVITAVSAGDVDVETRGAFSASNGFIYSGRLGTRGGDLNVRTYGGITIGGLTPDGGATFVAYLYANEGQAPCAVTSDAGACLQVGPNGNVKLYTEGDILVQQASYVYGGDTSAGPSGGNVSLHAAGNVRLESASYVYAGATGSLDFAAQGDVTLDTGSYAYAGESAPKAGGTPTNVTFRARSLAVTRGSYVQAGGQGGAITVATTSGVTIDAVGSYLLAANAACAPGGAVVIDSEGSVALTNGAYVESGNSTTSGCAGGAAAGGPLTLNARGTITAPTVDGGTQSLVPGAGSPNGVIALSPSSSVAIGVLDALLEPSVFIVSQPMTTTSAALLFGAVGATTPPSFFGAHILVSPAPAPPFAPMSDIVGSPLQAGWRYELLLQPRMFDPSAVDGVVVRVQ